ncbi:TIGR02269 family lipoprotein [Archangium violaceum]|uniref:SitA6 family polymorphic toxin lipoprotein n=1 Tax=Archangium violaceum TaxID=83451 RepID=UPI00194EC18C|nr:TIGR02269 family lipoprotein [Archangium violaceum]QRN97797.1 TIGR02269 family lipoprotein [Archangium violaceum]
MKRPFLPLFSLWLSLAALSLSGCGTTSPISRAWVEATQDDPLACEDPGADQCVVLACDGEQGECGIFRCEDVDPEAVTRASLAHGAELARGGAYYRPPFRGPGPTRNWRRTGLRDGVRPRLTFHFRYRDGYLPAFPRLEGKLVKHHLFPQAQDLAAWFVRNGINPHEWTMVIPEHAHLRIHRGGGRGGAWNEAWREFRNANATRKVPPAELLAKAFELAYRFDIVGPIVPYGHTLVPPGPQIFVP